MADGRAVSIPWRDRRERMFEMGKPHGGPASSLVRSTRRITPEGEANLIQQSISCQDRLPQGEAREPIRGNRPTRDRNAARFAQARHDSPPKRHGFPSPSPNRSMSQPPAKGRAAHPRRYLLSTVAAIHHENHAGPIVFFVKVDQTRNSCSARRSRSRSTPRSISDWYTCILRSTRRRAPPVWASRILRSESADRAHGR